MVYHHHHHRHRHHHHHHRCWNGHVGILYTIYTQLYTRFSRRPTCEIIAVLHTSTVLGPGSSSATWRQRLSEIGMENINSSPLFSPTNDNSIITAKRCVLPGTFIYGV
jgi:hypothetical protein